MYGKNQIENEDMATVIGIFERQYRENKPITVVKPGSQTRFTYINDTINICIEAWKKINVSIIQYLQKRLFQ